VLCSAGKPLVQYGGLHAFDATGRSLVSRLFTEGEGLHIEVDVTNASYPVTVDPIFSPKTKLTTSDGATDDHFGYSVAISGDTAVIGAHLDDDNGTDSGAAYVFVGSGSTWSEQQKLTASDGAGGDHFGYSVAVSGDTAVIGAHQDDDNGSESGSAYVFVRSGSTWTQQQKLTALDAAQDDEFGYGVAVSGNTAVTGAYRDDDNGSSSGSAYICQSPGIVIDYGSLGLHYYDGINWNQLGGANPEWLCAYDDKLVGDYGSMGLWEYDDVSSSWTKLGGADPDNTGNTMVAYEDGIAVDYGVLGLWYYDGLTWSQLGGADPNFIRTYGGMLIVDYDSLGLWEYDGASWKKLGGANPDDTGNCMVEVGF
jgi:hypothetical protein